MPDDLLTKDERDELLIALVRSINHHARGFCILCGAHMDNARSPHRDGCVQEAAESRLVIIRGRVGRDW